MKPGTQGIYLNWFDINSLSVGNYRGRLGFSVSYKNYSSHLLAITKARSSCYRCLVGHCETGCWTRLAFGLIQWKLPSRILRLACRIAIPTAFFPSPQCTATCGQGYQMRAVKCVVGAYVSVVDDNECNAATKPTDVQVSALMWQPHENLHLYICICISIKGRKGVDAVCCQSRKVEGHIATDVASTGRG